PGSLRSANLLSCKLVPLDESRCPARINDGIAGRRTTARNNFRKKKRSSDHFDFLLHASCSRAYMDVGGRATQEPKPKSGHPGSKVCPHLPKSLDLRRTAFRYAKMTTFWLFSREP